MAEKFEVDMMKFRYEDYEAQPEYWSMHGIEAPMWARELSEMGFHGVCALDFYGDIFGDELEEHKAKKDYVTGEYGAIALEIAEERLSPADVKRIQKNAKAQGKPVKLVRRKDAEGKWHDYRVHPKRYTITNDFQKLEKLVNHSRSFCLMAPVSYAGKARKDENARYIYALALEIDDIKPKTGLSELIYFTERKNRRMPRPTYIVCSGSGIHLYYVLEKPVPLFANILEEFGKAKRYLTENFWVPPISTAKTVQYEAVCQGFRIVGTRGKENNRVCMAFETGKSISLHELNTFLPADCQIREVYKSSLPLREAQKKYPEWYRNRIVEGKAKGVFYKDRAVYDSWKKRVIEGAVYRKRYYALENLCSLAVQCNIEPEEVERDCNELMELLETLTKDEDNHFTEYDVLCALYTYHEHKDDYKTFARKVEYISSRTGIELPKSRRNGRKQDEHLKIARFTESLKYPENSWAGAKPKEQMVTEYLKEHPDENPTQVAKALGISRTTVYKYMNQKKGFENPVADYVVFIRDAEKEMEVVIENISKASQKGNVQQMLGYSKELQALNEKIEKLKKQQKEAENQ